MHEVGTSLVSISPWLCIPAVKLGRVLRWGTESAKALLRNVASLPKHLLTYQNIRLVFHHLRWHFRISYEFHCCWNLVGAQKGCGQILKPSGSGLSSIFFGYFIRK